MPTSDRQDDLVRDALECYSIGNFEQTSALCRRYLSINPFSIDVINLNAVSMRRMGRIDSAVLFLHNALSIDPSHFDIIINLADILECADRHDEAVNVYLRAHTLNPTNLRVLSSLIRLFERSGASDTVTTLYWQWVILAPDLPQIEYHLGIDAYRNCHYEAALAHLTRAVRLMPDNAVLSYALGMTLMVDRRNAAITLLYRTICLAPDMVDAWVALGNESYRRSYFGQEYKAFYRALTLCPEDINNQKRVAICAIRSGFIEKYWKIRLDISLQVPVLADNIRRMPAWNGQNGAHLHLLVIGREGVGDEIFFAACLPDLMSRVGQVTLACTSRLVRLFRRSFPSVTVIPNAAVADTADYRVYIDALPLYFRKTPADFPHWRQYLIADAMETRQWRALFAVKSRAMIIGLAWHTVASAKRSIALCALIDIFVGSQATLVNLQYGRHDEAFAATACKADLTAIYGLNVDLTSDMDRWSAQIAACDLVITIDSTIAHLAGALGVPAWVLLPVEYDIRWGLGRYASPWYTSVRLFRQTKAGDWSHVFDEVRAALAEYMQSHNSR